jgi:hypothetical protein
MTNEKDFHKQDHLIRIHKALIEGEPFDFIQGAGLLTIGVRMGFDDDKDEYVIFQTTDYKSKHGFIKIKEKEK